MFTTAPYLYNIYKGNFFTKDYHLNRLFETFISQDSMFNITRIDENNNIYISENNNSLLRKKGKEEITNWFHFIEEKTMINIKEQLELNTYNFLNNEEKEFIIEYNNKMESLGYTCDNKIVDGICYGKYMMIYRKRDVKSKKVYSRIYFRGRGIVLRLFLSEKDVTKNSSYIDKSPMCIKESFTGDYAKCNHCRGDDCRFKKVYYINDTLYEKCNGLTFEFFNLKKENLQLYIDLFLLFYKSKK